jgi:hypothetical protein
MLGQAAKGVQFPDYLETDAELKERLERDASDGD